MGQEPKSSPQSVKRATPGPSAIASTAETQDKRGAATVDLVNFNPTPAVESGQPAGSADAALARRRIVRLTTTLGAIALVCVVLLLGPGLYRSFKAWRATALALQGEELIRNNQIGEAILTIHSAFLLSPDAPEVLRAMAQILTLLDIPGAMTYWGWLLQSKDATDDDRRAAVECAMHNDLYNEASHIIQDLLTREDKDVRNQLLAARWCTERGTPAQTMYYATRAVDDDPAYQPAVLFLAVQELANTYLHQNGIDSLFHLADSDDDSGLMALRHLALDPNLKPAEVNRLIARLRSHPLAGELERSAALNLEIKLHPGQREALIDQAVVDHQKSVPADLAAFAEWLNGHGEAARVLKLIPRERALSNKDLFTAYINALGGLNRWADLKTILSGATVPIEAPFVELYLSRCAGKMGDDQVSDLHWENAVSAAAHNPDQSLQLATYAEKLGQNERAAAVYRAVTQDPAAARIAYQGLLRVSSDKDTRTRRDLLEQVVSRWPMDQEMVSEYIYCNLLLNEHVQEMHQRAVDILAEDSYSISRRTNVALACLRLNDPADASKVYNRVSIDWKAVAVPDLVVYAATLQANGYTKSAHRLLASVNRHTLRPELRELIKSIP